MPSTSSSPENLHQDMLMRVMFERASARAHLVRIHRSWLEVAHRHDVSPEAMSMLGEMSAAAILLSASLKYQGAVILQIHGDGPVRLAVAECDASLQFRSTIKMSEELAVSPGAGWKELVNRNNLGRFSVVLDPKVEHQSPYQGIVPLHEEGVAQALQSYMTRSEQLPTRLWLACDGDTATGLLLQKMPDQPGATEDDWHRIMALAETVTTDELLHQDARKLMHQLFWQEGPRLLGEQPVTFHCPCSRTKVSRMLRTLGEEEVASILAEQGQVEVNCDFCNNSYEFDAVDCAQLFSQDHPPSEGGAPTVH